ncbi:MAG: hypothetical protein IJM75_09690 [Ruminococcus sp.]|nr:hypothetical protein [Ruminococcus sp.]
MTDELLKELEGLVGSDNFEADMEEIMSRLQAEGAGFEIVKDLLGIMERHPLDDFGMPGAMVHFIEGFYPKYVPLLADSLKRSPAMQTVWMLNRCINGVENKEEYINILKSISENEAVDKMIRDSAREFYEFHTGQ